MKGPTTIGRYRLLRRIGAGGMGVVYEAEDGRDNTKVALKVLLPHAAEEADGLHRFKREFRALARLRHPNVVRVFDAGIDDDTPFIAMELVAGKDVRSYLRGFPEGPVRDRELVRVLRQLFGALAHIHARHIVHRDLKPENILVSADGRVKLMDFGVARVRHAPTETSGSGLLGTFAYMSPEQVTTGEADGRSDLYAVGVLIFELVTGKYPFPVEPPAAALHHHVNTPPELVRHVNPKADPLLSALAQRLLQKDPMDRPQSAEEATAFLSGNEAALLAERQDGSKEIPAQLFVPRFVARSAEIEALEGLASDAAAGRGRVLLIEGPSGVGKTRLVEEMRQRTKRRAHVLVGQAAPEGMQAYGALQGILDGIAAVAGRASEELGQRIVGRDVALVSAVSPRLAALGGPVSTALLDAGERKIRLHKAMVGVIGRLALSKPVILVLEDIHWADSLTLELLWDASRTLLAARPNGMPGETVCPVGLVLTRRMGADGPDPSDALIRRLEPRVRLSRRLITALGGPDVAEMLRTMTGVARPRAEVVEALLEESQGLPLMVQEVISAWVTEGVLVRNLGVWGYRGKPLDADQRRSVPAAPSVITGRAISAEISGRNELISERNSLMSDGNEALRPDDSHDPTGPRNREEVALGRLKALVGNARSLAIKLALLGRVLPAELVTAVAGLPEEQLLDAIDELVRTRLLVEEIEGNLVRYRFAFDGFRDAVARSLSREARATLHLELARSVEKSFRHARGELAHVLARHYRYAGRPERAVRYLVMSSASAASRGDLDGALKRLDDAAGIVDESPRAPSTTSRSLKLQLARIDLLLDFGRTKEALENADPALAARARDPRLMTAELLLRRASCQFTTGPQPPRCATDP